ncbi:MAG TPA: DMT family transporter [Gaiellales bacterium]|jgi:drug/metabolite transporter (DMT)-like permease|nr:DMT family transporter [Gaiellales bacterium]
MLAIAAALGAALAWGLSAGCDNRSTRMIGPLQALAWVQLIGFFQVLPFALYEGVPSMPSGHALAWIVVGGVGCSAGLTLAYAAIGRGAVSVVTPVMAVDGALAALASVALGEHIAIATAAGLVLVVAGMLAVLHATAAQERAGIAGHSLAAVLLAAGSACAFSLFLLAAIRSGDALSDSWLQLIYRVVPFAVVGGPLLWRRELGRPGKAWTFVTVAAGLQFAGFVLYRVAGRAGGVAIPSVLSSQFAIFALLGGVLLFGERLSRRQVGGVAGLLLGVAVVAGTHG